MKLKSVIVKKIGIQCLMNKKSYTFLNAPYVKVEEISNHSICVVGAPFDGTVTNRKGTSLGADAIRKMSNYFCEVYNYIKDSEVHDNSRNQKFTMPKCDIYDIGNVKSNSIDKLFCELLHNVSEIYKRNSFSLILGGEHTITIPSFYAFYESFNNVAYVQIDSHMDFGNKSDKYGLFYRGAVSRRVSEKLENDYKRMFWIGLSDYTSFEQINYLRNEYANIYTIYDIRKRGIEVITNEIVSMLSQYDKIYISLDVDVLDPAYVTGVSGPPIFGMSTYELLCLLQGFTKINVGALDVVEHAPNLDVTNASSYLIAQILFKNIFLLI